MAYSYKPFLKVLLLGNPNVGKTCLVNRYVNKIYKDHYKSTTSAGLWTQEIFINNRLISMQIWDTVGQERFQSLGSTFYRGANCCILVYDVTDRNSFDSLNSWRNEFLIQANPRDPENFPFVMLGNKMDELVNRQVTMREAQQWCKLHDIIYYETSAKDDTCVDLAFETAARQALDLQLHHQLAGEYDGSFIVVDQPPKSSKKCSCS